MLETSSLLFIRRDFHLDQRVGEGGSRMAGSGGRERAKCGGIGWMGSVEDNWANGAEGGVEHTYRNLFILYNLTPLTTIVGMIPLNIADPG